MTFKLELKETRNGCAMMERQPRYDILVNGEKRGQLYFNIRGYVGNLPLPNRASLSMPESGISAFRREVARINREAKPRKMSMEGHIWAAELNKGRAFIPKDVWESMWRDLKVAAGRMSLNQYAIFCDATKREWSHKYPGFDFSNARYVAHIEDALRKGITVPQSVIEAIDPDELRYDYSSFPNLAPKRGYTIRVYA